MESCLTLTRKRVLFFLVLILLLGFALRIWGIGFGLPYVYHNDESFEVYRALRLGAGDFQNSLFGRVTKSGYFYLLFIEYAIYFVYLFIIDTAKTGQEFAYQIVQDPSGIWTIGRTTTAVIGTFNLYIVYCLGHRVHSAAAGLFASFLLAVAYLHVVHSHYITVDIPMTCSVSAALYYAVRLFQTGAQRDYLKSGLFAGLSAMIKQPGVIAIASIFIAHYLRMNNDRRPLLGPESFRCIGISITFFVFIYVLGNPSILWKWNGVVRGIIAMIFDSGTVTGVPVIETEEGVNRWLYYLGSLTRGVGFSASVLGIFGVLRGFHGKRGEYLILSVFVALFYVAISLVQDQLLLYDRYVLPILPPLTLLISFFILDCSSYLKRYNVKKIAFVGVLLAILGIPNVLKSIQFDILHTKKDTRTMAKEWVESHIAPGAKIFLEGNPEETSQLKVPLESTGKNILEMAKRLEKLNPGKSLFLKMRANVYKGPAYDLVTVRHFESYRRWEFYKRNGVQVVIRRGKFLHDRSVVSQELNPALYSRLKFDEDLHADPNMKMAVSFDPEKLYAPGPYLRIYQVMN